MKKFLASFTLLSLFSQFIYFSPQQVVYAAANPACGLTGNFDPFMGESTIINIDLSNGGADTGFAPFVDLILPPETSFGSANYLGINSTPVGGVQVVTDDDGGDPLTGTVTSPITGEVLTLPIDSEYIVIRYPLGSFTNTQGTARMIVSVDIDGGLDPDVPLVDPVSVRCGFELGEDALDNPGADPVLITAPATNPLTPRIMQNEKSFVTTSHNQEGETATGPNFPITYTIDIDVADGETVTAATATDTLAPELILTEILSVDDGGAGFTITYTPEVGAPQVSSSVPFTIVGPTAGGSLAVTINSITGTDADDDASFRYSAYIADLDKDGNDVLDPDTPNDTTNVVNGVTTAATFNALSVSAPLDEATVVAKAVSMQKTVAIGNNVGASGFTPGDTVTYTVGFQVSDYFSFDQLVVDDILPDGVFYDDASASVTITEDGSDTVVSFTETDTAEGSFLTAPAYDFTTECAACSLAVIEDTSNDDDANAPDDGRTRLVFDIAALIGDGQLDGGLLGGTPEGQPTEVVLTYDAIIQESFIDGVPQDQSIDATDVLVNDATSSFNLTSGSGTFGSDASSASFSIQPPTFGKSMAGVVDNVAGSVDVPPFVNNPITVNPGGGVVFSLTVDVPSGDLEDLIITDFLPIPFFDATDLTNNFDAATTTTPYNPVEGDVSSTSIPAAGFIGYGPGTSGLTAPFPTPSVIGNASDNTLVIDYANESTFDSQPSDPISIELLFHVTTTNDPFASNLGLVNVASFTGANSDGPISIGTGLVNMETGGPDVQISKGVVDTAVSLPELTPVTVGPVGFDGTTTPTFTAPFSTEELATYPVGSSVDNIDAEDRITFAVILENAGTISAYDMTLNDTLPTGFRAPASAAELNLQVYDAAGTNLAGQTTGGLFGFIPAGGTSSGGDGSLVFVPAYALPPYGTTGSVLTGDGLADEGENIIVVTYDLYPDVTVDIEAEPENNAVLTNYAAGPGGENYALNPLKNTASTSVGFAEPSLVKTASAHPTADDPATTFPNFSIGELVRYTLQVTVPEGTTSDLNIVDNIPGRMGYYMTNGVTIDTSASCSGNAFAGTVPAITVTPAGAGTAGSGADITIDFDADVVTTGDNDEDNNTFCLVYDTVFLTNAVNNQTRTNTASLTYGTNGTIPNVTEDVRGVQPNLNINKSLDSNSAPGGSDLVFTIGVSHDPVNGRSPAYDIVITDTVPADLTVNTSFSSDGLDNDGDGLIDGADADEVDGAAAPFYAGGNSFTWNGVNNPNNGGDNKYEDLPLGESFALQFGVSVPVGVFPGQQITNTANISYESGPNTNVVTRTYLESEPETFTVVGLDVEKEVTDTSFTQTGTAGFNAAQEDLAIGESVTYQITVDVPVSSFTNLVVVDTLPTGFEVTAASVDSSTAGITFTPNVTFTDNITTFTIGDVVSSVDGEIVLELTAVVTDDAAISAGTDYINNVSMDFDENSSVPYTASAEVDVVAPNVEVDKNVDVSSGSAGDEFVFTIDVDNTGSGPAFDISMTDTVPSDFTIVDVATDGLDNDGDGLVDGADSDETSGAFLTGNSFSWNTANSGAHFTELASSGSFSIQYKVTMDVTATIGTALTNTAAINFDSAPGVNANERSGSNSNGRQVTVNLGSIAKSLEGPLTGFIVGQTIPYRITVTIPQGTVDPLEISDVLPAGLAIDNSSILMTASSGDIAIENNPATLTVNPTSISIAPGQSQAITFDLGEVINSNTDAGTAETIQIDYNATVLDTTDNSDGTTHVNSATVDFGGVGTDGPAIAAVATVEEPDLVLQKSSGYTVGDTATFSIRVENNASFSGASAHGVVITDVIPAGLTYAAGEVYTNVPSTPTVDISSLPTVTYTFDEIPPTFNSANPLVFSYNTTIPLTTAEGTSLTNDLSLTATGLDGVVAGERSYSEDTDATITVTRPNLSTSNKTLIDLNGGDPEANDVLQYTINVINTGNTAASGITVIDNLPLHVNDFTITTLPSSGTNNSQPSPDGANGTGLLQFDNITLDAAGGANDSVQIVYTVVINGGVADETIIMNNVAVEPATEGGPGATDSVSTGLDFPILNIQKSVNRSAVDAGTPLSYTIDISNTGTADATNVTLVDVLPSQVTYLDGTLELGGTPLTDIIDGDEGDFNGTNAGAVTVTIPVIAEGGGSIQLTFDVGTPSVSSAVTATNTVNVTDDQGSVGSSSVDTLISPKSSGGGGGSSVSGSNEKIVYGCYCNASNAASCTRMVVGIDEDYQSCSANSDCSCSDTGSESPLEELLNPEPEEESETESEEVEEEPVVEEEQEEPLVCEDEQLERLSDNFLYTNKIPFTGNVSNFLRTEYDAYSVLNEINANHPYYQSALDMVYQGIIDDYRSEDLIRINDPIIRAETAKIAARSGEINIVKGEGCIDDPFDDVYSGSWYGDYVINLEHLGILDGYPDGLYRPDQQAQFDEVLKILVNTFDLDSELRSRLDNETWGQRYYDLLVAKNIIPGEMRGKNLATTVTRGEAFEMIARILKMKDSGQSTYQFYITMDVPGLGLSDLNAKQTLISDSSVWVDALSNHGLGYYYDSPNDNMIVFGHSSIWPQDTTPYGAVFEQAITDTQVGDEFSLTVEGQEKEYKIISRDRVLWSDYQFIQDSNPNVDAVWFTCDTDFDYRWVFKAEEL